jgi:hypothetical protein
MKSYLDTMQLIMGESKKRAIKKCLSMGFPAFDGIDKLIEVDKLNGTDYLRQFSKEWKSEENKLIDEQNDDFKVIKILVDKTSSGFDEKRNEYYQAYEKAWEESQKATTSEERRNCFDAVDKMFNEIMDEENRSIDEIEKEYYASKSLTV